MGRPCTICASIESDRVAAEMIAAGASDQAIADRLGAGRMSVHRHRHSHVVLPAPALEAAATGASVADQTPPASDAPPAADKQVIDEIHRRAAERRRAARNASPAAIAPAAALAPGSPAAAKTATAAPPPAAARAPAKDIINAALGLPRQAEKLARIEDRLERMAVLAEQNGAVGQVVAATTAQLRAVETGSKLAGVGGFAPMAAQMAGAGFDKPVFTVEMHFGERPESHLKLELRPWDGKPPRNLGQAEAAGPPTIDAEPEQTEGEASDPAPETAAAAFTPLAALPRIRMADQADDAEYDEDI